MKSDFLLAITQLAAEKNLSKEVVLGAVEAALVSAYRKDSFAATQNIEAKIDPTTGRVKVWAEKTVTAEPVDKRQEISLKDAREINTEAELDDLIMVEDTPHNAGRIAAQTAKQVILQRLHEAEHGAIFEEYAGKEGDIISAIVERVEPKQVLVSLGRGEAIMPLPEQMPTERYRSGQRLKVFLVEVARTAKGPLLIVSRSHPNLVRRLFELEVPEVFNGVVEIKSVAREAGFRSKVGVVTTQTGIDPVGCCVGLRGIRIQNIVTELSGEKIDVVAWNEDPAIFIANALSPAKVVRVELDEAEKSARVIIPDRLTGWRIDIKSATEADAEAALAGETVGEAAEVSEPVLPGEEPAPVAAEKETAKEEEGEAIPITVFETPAAPEAAVADKPAIRFAEDLRPTTPPQAEVKTRKKKKKKANLGKDSIKDGIKLKKKKRGAAVEIEDEEEYM